MKSRWKKGSALLQTLVMSVLLSMVAISMMKWVLARYTMSARNYRSTVSVARSGGYSQQLFSSWNFGAVANNGSMTSPDPGGQVISFTTSGGGMRTVTITSNEDQ